MNTYINNKLHSEVVCGGIDVLNHYFLVVKLFKCCFISCCVLTTKFDFKSSDVGGAYCKQILTGVQFTSYLKGFENILSTLLTWLTES